MAISARDMARWTLRPLIRSALHRPLGIWIAWAGLIYFAVAMSERLWIFLSRPWHLWRPYSDVLVAWPVYAAAVSALCARRLAAVALCWIAFAFMLVHTIYHLDWPGSAFALLGALGLAANRRWFNERLPNIER